MRFNVRFRDSSSLPLAAVHFANQATASPPTHFVRMLSVLPLQLKLRQKGELGAKSQRGLPRYIVSYGMWISNY